MSLRKKEERTVLLSDKLAAQTKRTSHLLLVLMMMLQLIFPVVLSVNASSEDDADEPTTVEVQAQDDHSDADIESPTSHTETEETVEEIEEVEEPEAPVTPAPEEKEEPSENVVDEPVNDPKENTNEQPNAPPKAPEEPKAPEAKPEPKPEEKPAPEQEAEVEAVEIVEEIGYDPGAMLDGFPATAHSGEGASLMEFLPGSLGSALTLLQSSKMIKSTSNLQPGEVRTSKTAERVPGMVNTWDITVRIEGRDAQDIEDTDVVLVIDRSGSMQGNKMTNAKAAANSFISNMIVADSNLRIAIVSFASNVTVHNPSDPFSQSIPILQNRVNGLNASGATLTQGGIIQGRKLLDASTADNKYLVLLSDGEPTYSYRPLNWTTVNENRRGGYLSGNTILTTNPTFLNYNNRYGVYDGLYNENSVVGSGASVTSSAVTYNNVFWPITSTAGDQYWPAQSDRSTRVNLDYVDSGAAAIKAGEDSRSGISGIFTIALQAGTTGTPILEAIASPGMAYAPQDPTDLQGIYDEIGTQIQTQNALRNVKLTDVMGDGFSLIPSTLQKTEGNTNISSNTITWTIDPAVQQLVPGTTDVRYAEMTYRVEINDDILDLDGAKTDEHKLFETNKITKLEYTNTNDQKKTVDITSPKVDPVLLKMKKKLLNPASNENRRFNVNVNKPTPNGYNHTESLVPNADYVWLTSLRHEGTYKVTETGVTGTPASTLSDFIIRYEVDGEEKDTFVVNHPGGQPRGDVAIQVTNRQYEDAIPDDPLIRISKTFSGLTQQQIDQLTNFKITITSQSDPTRTEDLFLADAVRTEETNGDITYSWVLDGWPPGTYTVTESGEELTNYEVIIENDGTVTTVPAEINWITALWKKPNTETNNDLTHGGSYTIPNIVATKLTTGEGVFVWTEKRLSASERLAVVQALSGFNELGLNINNGFWYSGEDIEGTDFYFRGHQIQYNFDTGNLHIPEPKQWALIISGEYEFVGGDPADIAVKNTYKLQKRGFEFTKTDELGNPLTGATFTLEKHDGDNRIPIPNVGTDPIFAYEDLTVGTYTLTETQAPDGYYLPDDASWTFDVIWDEETNQLEIVYHPGDEIVDGKIVNYPKGMLPETGGSGIGLYLLIGMFSLTALVTIYVWRDKRDGVNQND